MAGLTNPTTERLKKGEVALGVGVRLARSVEIAKMMRASGMDWLFIDLEHGSLSLETVSQVSIAALDNNIAPIVRVPTRQWDMASRALDGGAQGIVLPHVDTEEDAKEAVHYLRFPPLGHRATLGGMPQYDYLPVKATVVSREVNAATLLAVMIESPVGVANAKAIAAVEGIDILFVGVNDLAQEMGLSGALDHPDVVAACVTIVEAAQAAGKWAGIGGIGDEALMRRYIDLGMRFILAGNDFSFMMSATRQRTDALRRRD